MLMRVVSLGFAMLASLLQVVLVVFMTTVITLIKSYSSVVVVKFTTEAEFHYFCRTILIQVSDLPFS
jgi:hypothetical protein